MKAAKSLVTCVFSILAGQAWQQADAAEGKRNEPATVTTHFSEHLIGDGYARNYGIAVADIDGDGDLDLTSSDDNLYWFENDLNGDRRLEVAAVAERGSLEFHWRRNEAKQAQSGNVSPALDVSNQLQLFLDDELIESMANVRQVLHHPQPAEVVLKADRPYEDGLMFDPVVIKDGERYRMWYRTNFYTSPPYTGYAESSDGIHWTKPDLGLVEFKGSKENNLVWPIPGGKGRSLSVFKDDNPAAPPEERYKAIGSEHVEGTWRRAALHALVSQDGLRWRHFGQDPLIMAPEQDEQFDSHNIALWDSARRQYVIYARGWYRQGAAPEGSKHVREEPEKHTVVELPSGEIRQYPRVRDIRRYTSKDFRDWSEPEYIDMGSAPLEHLYKNSAVPYYRRPDLILMFPKRFVPFRNVHPDFADRFSAPVPKSWVLHGLSDVVFMFSRDGFRFNRHFMEAFLRPGRDPRNWAPRAIQIGPTLVPTGEGEMSVYYMEHYYLPEVHIRRGVLRVDGFVSLRAPYQGGTVLTKPLRFSGSKLQLNYATSAVGSLRVEIQDASGQPIAGYRIEECPEIFGDEIERAVTWKAGGDLGSLAGKTVRLKFEIKDGDLYSFRFQ